MKWLLIEVNEYTRRNKITEVKRTKLAPTHTLKDLRETIRERDREKTAVIMAEISDQRGHAELGRMLLRLGSGYLDVSLSHSVSCTAFIFLEIEDRGKFNSWPSFSVLVDYFCKGGYSEEPETNRVANADEIIDENMLRAVSGRGIGNLHDTITIYAISMSRPHLGDPDYSHLVESWLRYIGDKTAEPFTGFTGAATGGEKLEFSGFEELFRGRKVDELVNRAWVMLADPVDRTMFGKYLLRCCIGSIGSSVDPHVFTGLGSVLWVIDRFWKTPPIPLTALYQYLDYVSRAILR